MANVSRLGMTLTLVGLTIVFVVAIALALPLPSPPRSQDENASERYITIENFTPLPRTPKPHGTLTEKQMEYLQLPR